MSGGNKRKKLSSSCWDTRYGPKTRSQIVSRTLDTLPPEVLEMILKFLPYKIVASSIRLVSRHFMTVATSVLNGAFFSMGQRLSYALACADAKKLTVKNVSDIFICNRTHDILEILYAQWRMLRTVTWRYTHPPRPDRFSRLCFYGGDILDKLNQLLYLAWYNPIALLGPNAPDSDINNFCNLCKRFMNYFEKVSEKKLNRSPLVSGCKVVDILDCLIEGRQVLSYRLTKGRGTRDSIICMQLQYVIPRAWFTCLSVPCAFNENSWRDAQRFMYLRLRRLVGSVNEHYLERVHYQRLLDLQLQSSDTPRKPLPSTYSGYGEYGGQFFYYGNMNKYAYVSKHRQGIVDYDEGGDEGNDITMTTQTCNLVITIELRCSIELAPLAVRSLLKSDDIDNNLPLSHDPELYIKMNVACPASINNRLPSNFTWEQRAPSHRHRSRPIII